MREILPQIGLHACTALEAEQGLVVTKGVVLFSSFSSSSSPSFHSNQ